MIDRQLKRDLKTKFFSGKAIVIVGPRQVGKTTLINNLIDEFQDLGVLKLDGDDPTVIRLLESANTTQLKQIVGDNKVVFIDEAQRIQNIGVTSKIIIDQMNDVQLILSGSSALDINQLTQEPLTGRKWYYHLWPISWQELEDYIGYVGSEQDLENRLIFGCYPDVINHVQNQEVILRELATSYLYKDVLSLGQMKKPQIIEKLVQALAYQVGSEVSYAELSQLIGIDAKTVSHYIDLLELSFVLFRLPSYSRNLRNEIKSGKKIYFYDNGIRNAVIGDYRPFIIRDDKGALWENFLISERIKQLNYAQTSAKSFFWRTKQQQEIDYLEKDHDELIGYEFKWNNKKYRFPKTFTNTYDADIHLITRENFRDFVGFRS